MRHDSGVVQTSVAAEPVVDEPCVSVVTALRALTKDPATAEECARRSPQHRMAVGQTRTRSPVSGFISQACSPQEEEPIPFLSVSLAQFF